MLGSAAGGRATRAAAIFAVALAGCCVLYGSSLGGGFLNWDDRSFVVDNPVVTGGLRLELLGLFGELHRDVYTPLHFISYALQYELWGLWTPGYRAFNLALFAGGLALLFALLRRCSPEAPTWIAALAAALYAVHPSHVESVAWITGLKDVQSFTLGLAAALVHLRAGRERSRGLWAAGLMLFIAALLSKNTVVVLPALLALLDASLNGSGAWRSLLRVAPHLALAAVISVIVAHHWAESDILRRTPQAGLAVRVGASYAHYLKATVWPFSLAPLYALDGQARTGAAVVGWLFVVAACVAAAALLRRRGLWGVAPAWFVLSLVPFCNIRPLYYWVNDRYLILPTLALAFVAHQLLQRASSAGRARPTAKRRRRRADRPRSTLPRPALGAAVVLMLIWGATTVSLAHAWSSSDSLWRLAVRRSPESYYARLKLAEVHAKVGRFALARHQLVKAARLRALPSAFLRLFAVALEQDVRGATSGAALSKSQRAALLAAFGRALREPAKLLRIASQLERQRQLNTAWAVLYTAHRQRPAAAEPRLRLASNSLKRGQPDEALQWLDRRPSRRAQLRRYFALKTYALSGAGRRTEALRLLRRAAAAFPGDPLIERLSRRLATGR